MNKLSLHDAGVALNKKYKIEYWFQAVGVAEPDTLYVYTQYRVPKDVEKIKKFEGYNVYWRYVGKIKEIKYDKRS